jgi:hypothetical protein
MPVMDMEKKSSVNPEDGTPIDVLVPRARTSSMRRCDSCSLQHVCPQFQPGSECAFELPVRITTKDQLVAVLTWCLEVQTGRIAMAKLSEDLQGGYLDKNLSDELERMFKMAERLKEIKDDRDILDLRVRARGGAGGLVSQFFSAQAGNQARQLPQGGLSASETDRFAADFVDAEVVDDGDDDEG